MNTVVAADARGALHYDVRAERGAVTDHHVGTDHAVRADLDILADAGCFGNLGSCMNLRHQSLRSAHISSASATVLPSTLARQ